MKRSVSNRGRSVAGAAVIAMASLALLQPGAQARAVSQAGEGTTPPRLARVQAVASSTGNPLANRPWVAPASGDQVNEAYDAATGDTQALLAKIALQPRTRWYGAWVPTSEVRDLVSGQIAEAQNGNPETLVPIADFKLKPWEGVGGSACDRLPTAAEEADYKSWNQELAAGISDAHVSIVMQPDGPIALCAPHGSKIYSHLIRFAVKTLSALPNVSVYIDAGASDWQRNDPSKSLNILLPAGVKYARGFALNSTHYASTEDQISFGTAITKALAKRGVTGKHFIVNTAANGRPFNGYDYKGPNFDNAATCKSRHQKHCVTLGIPPTADVANSRWGLSSQLAHEALRYCDGYQWIGRPWLTNQSDPFDLKRALAVARTTPY